jgi:2-oxoglutarate dehydrogenase complex dehydrogenase (E1) component-like enzyme
VDTTAALLLHGDASMAGLGIVPEALQLSKLPGYSIGGSVHVVINNQIGFTTMPKEGRSSMHCTDCAKAAGIPILHAYADCPESVVLAMETAALWRSKFHTDIVVDVCGYRRNGHNEQDDPSLTLPITQRAIEQMPSVVDVYRERLVREDVVTQEEIERWEHSLLEEYEEGRPCRKGESVNALVASILQHMKQGCGLQSLSWQKRAHTKKRPWSFSRATGRLQLCDPWRPQ